MKSFTTSLLLGSVYSKEQTQPKQIRDPLAWAPTRTLLKEDNLEGFSQLWQENRLDHFDKSEKRMYKQRYWQNDANLDGEGPIFLYVCGEWRCSPPSEDQAAFALAKKLGGRMMAIEHRYYGDSQPFSDEQGGWTTENLKFLSSYQALADIAYFIDVQNKKSGKKNQWVVVGGSYPGALVAWFKSLYPEHAAVAWSSSGVIHPIENFTDFDLNMYKTTMDSGKECTQKINDLTENADAVFKKGDKESKYELFQKMHNDILDISYGDFMFYFADLLALSIQYGRRTELCDLITSDDFNVDPFKNLGAYGEKNGVVTSDYATKYLQRPAINVNSAARQWTYQYCTEFGFFQTPNLEHPQRSAAISEEYWYQMCKDVFGQDLKPPSTDEHNKRYGGLDIKGKNIYFFNAGDDPWQYAGMTKIHDPVKQSQMKAFYIDCKDCGHCIDLHSPLDSDPEILKEGRADAYSTITQWLKEDKIEKELAAQSYEMGTIAKKISYIPKDQQFLQI